MSFNTKGLMSSNRQDWKTPREWYKRLDDEFHFDFDPCPVNPNFDGLSINWGICNFVNPPFNQTSKWFKKGFEEWQKRKTVVFFVPARTDTKAFHKYIYPYAEIRFIEGRVKYDDGDKGAPFPTAIYVLDAQKLKRQFA